MDAGPVTRALGLQVRGLPVQLLGGEKRAGGHPPALAWRPGPLHCLAPTAHSACLLSPSPLHGGRVSSDLVEQSPPENS